MPYYTVDLKAWVKADSPDEARELVQQPRDAERGLLLMSSSYPDLWDEDRTRQNLGFLKMLEEAIQGRGQFTTLPDFGPQVLFSPQAAAAYETLKAEVSGELDNPPL